MVKKSAVYKEGLKKVFRDYAEALVLAVSIAVIVRTFLFAAYKMPTDAMYPNLLTGDFIIGSKLSYGLKVPLMAGKKFFAEVPKRGEVVIFKCPHLKNVDCIRRVIGMPGDRIEIKKKNLILNKQKSNYSLASDAKGRGVELWEKNNHYTSKISINDDLSLENYAPVVVPPGHIFVLADFRDGSEDSRNWGFVPISTIVGKALFVWLSIDWLKPKAAPNSTPEPLVRWDRVLQQIH